MFGSGGLFGPVYDVLKKQPVLKRDRFELDPALAAYYRQRSGELEGDRATDKSEADQALRAYQSTLPGLDTSYQSDQAYLEGLRPGGTQERRFSDLIRGYMDKARAASKVGLDQAQAQEKARLAAGGNSAFADSSLRRRQSDLLQSNNELGLAREESGLQLNNANQFLRGYRPGASLALASDRTRYATTPLQIRAGADQLGAARSAGVEQGLKGAYDDFYHWYQPKNFWTYAQAADETIGNIYEMYSNIQTGGATGMGKGMGGGGGGGGGGSKFPSAFQGGGGGSYGGYGFGGSNDYLGGV